MSWLRTPNGGYVDPPPHTDLTAGDIARIGHELTAVVGTPVLALMGRPQRQQRKGTPLTISEPLPPVE